MNFLGWIENNQKKTFFFILFTTVFLSFRFNFFMRFKERYDQVRFTRFSQFSDALVVGKLYADSLSIKSTPIGMGFISLGNFRMVPASYEKLLEASRLEKSSTGNSRVSYYGSQVGLQSLILKPFWSLSNMVFKNSPRKLLYNYRFIKTITALINAFVLSLFFFWMFLEFKSKITLFLMIPLIFYQDTVMLFGKNVYWQMWAWYAPLVFNIYFLRKFIDVRKDGFTNRHYCILCSANMMLIYIKCLMGYEYISTILVASILPFIYYGIKYNKISVLLKPTFFVSCFGVIGFLFAIGTHYWILDLYGRPAKEWLIQIISKSTYGREDDPSLFLVLSKYFTLKQLVLFTSFFFAFLYSLKSGIFKRDRRHLAIFITSCIAFIGTMSWHILAKGHGNHVAMNMVLWYLPLNPLIYMFLIWTLKYFGVQKIFNWLKSDELKCKY